LQDKLWTEARLQIRGWKNNYFCALCERNLETTAHLFMECPYAVAVWTLVAIGPDAIPCTPLNGQMNWTLKIGSPGY
jgi:hypothetical protein